MAIDFDKIDRSVDLKGLHPDKHRLELGGYTGSGEL